MPLCLSWLRLMPWKPRGTRVRSGRAPIRQKLRRSTTRGECFRSERISSASSHFPSCWLQAAGWSKVVTRVRAIRFSCEPRNCRRQGLQRRSIRGWWLQRRATTSLLGFWIVRPRSLHRASPDVALSHSTKMWLAIPKNRKFLQSPLLPRTGDVAGDDDAAGAGVAVVEVPREIMGQEVKRIRGRHGGGWSYHDRISVRCNIAAHPNCNKSRSLALDVDLFGPTAAETFLSTWLAGVA